jgi:hypothetical protein
MIDSPRFDPFEVLGVGPDADAVVVQLAYRARIRAVHPDRAGDVGLAQAKRLNVARDWLLDPDLRARLRPPMPGSPPAAGSARATRVPRPGPRPRPRGHSSTDAGGRTWSDPLSKDLGPRTEELRTFLRSIGTLTPDERARVNHSLGDARPIRFEAYQGYIQPALWSRARSLRSAVAREWERGSDEPAPVLYPLGRLLPSGLLVASAYAQWILLSDFFRHELGEAVFRGEHVVDSFAARCRGPWEGSLGQTRYGPNGPRVQSILDAAGMLSVGAAERLAVAWQRHLGRDGMGLPSHRIGPGVWLPAPPNVPEVLRVSGFLAAVDATRMAPPAGLAPWHHDAFHYALRLTAHVVALGLIGPRAAELLRPWHEALGTMRP